MAIDASQLALSDEEIRSMAFEDVVDPNLEETLRLIQAEMSKALVEYRDEFPRLAVLDWVDVRERDAAELRDALQERADDLRHGVAAFEGRPGEEALLAALRSQAAQCEARRAEAAALAADAGRVWDSLLRTMARPTDDDEEVLASAAAEDFLEFVAREMDGGEVPEADAARADAIDAAARAGGGVGARFAAAFAGIAERVRRRAAECGDEALKEALGRRAAEVEAACAEPEALVAKMLDSGWWRLWRHLNRHAGGLTPTPTPTPAPPHPL